jgi:hypothetical protein
MDKSRSSIVLLVAGVVVCVLLYGAWHYYQQSQAEEAHRSYFSAPYSGDTFKSPAPPPPQPHS